MNGVLQVLHRHLLNQSVPRTPPLRIGVDQRPVVFNKLFKCRNVLNALPSVLFGKKIAKCVRIGAKCLCFWRWWFWPVLKMEL